MNINAQFNLLLQHFSINKLKKENITIQLTVSQPIYQTIPYM